MLNNKLKEIFSKPRLILLGKVVVSVVGAVLTFNLVLLFLVGAGGIFGLVILTWHTRVLKDLINWRCGAFLLASILIAAVVFFTIYASLDPDYMQFNLEVFGPGVLVGTVLLPIAHSLLLGTTWKRTWIAIPCIYALWVLFITISEVFCGKWAEPFGFYEKFSLSIVTHVSIWQAAYLVSMFGFRKKELEAAESSE